jgi:hypothetical protein
MKYALLSVCVLALAACEQANAPAPDDTRVAGEAGLQPEPNEGAMSSDGGRSSAATGATNQGLESLPAGDATTEQQPEPPS